MAASSQLPPKRVRFVGCPHVLRRIIWHPRDEGDLAALALTALCLVLDIEHGVSASNALFTLLVLALGVQELLSELGVVWVGGGLLNNNLLPVVGDFVDDPLGGLAELEVVEGLDALGCDGNAVFAKISVLIACAPSRGVSAGDNVPRLCLRGHMSVLSSGGWKWMSLLTMIAVCPRGEGQLRSRLSIG